MNERINDIVSRIHALEQELETELDQARENFRYRLEDRKVRFEQEILQQHLRLKVNLARYVLTAQPRHLLSAPFIYAVFPVLLLLDLMASLYQAVCFPLYGIPKVKRNEYLVYDRHQLAYLNLLEKFNCFYCSYANGLLTYLKEIVGRTEQYWCPIKHAQRIQEAHSRYSRFADYGDAETFRRELEKIRRDFER